MRAVAEGSSHDARRMTGADRLRRAGQRGFTLLELLAAMAIFALMAGSLYPVISGALEGRRAATARSRMDAEARAILDRLEQDIAGNIDAGFPADKARRFVAATAPDRRADAERVLLETTTLVARGVTPADAFLSGEDVGALSIDRGDQAQVLWRIDGDGRLLRQELRPPRAEPPDWAELPFEVLSERAAVTLEFYEPETWLPTWNSAESGPQRGRAPVAVRATVTIHGDDPGGGLEGGASPLELVASMILPVVESSGDARGIRSGRGRR